MKRRKMKEAIEYESDMGHTLVIGTSGRAIRLSIGAADNASFHHPTRSYSILDEKEGRQIAADIAAQMDEVYGVREGDFIGRLTAAIQHQLQDAQDERDLKWAELNTCKEIDRNLVKDDQRRAEGKMAALRGVLILLEKERA